MKSRLVIAGNEVGFLSELPISQTMAVNDVRNVGATAGAYTNTIQVPGGDEVDRLFEFIFQVNSVSTNFNPNLTTEAEYYVNDVRVFKGALQLLKIRKKLNGTITEKIYECSLVGENGNIFMAIAGKYLTDIDFSDLDHTFSISTTNPQADPKFNASVSDKYVYPFIDYGVNDINLGEPLGLAWKFVYLKPAIFEKEYLLRIFANAGYSWGNTSWFNFFDASKIIIPCVKAGRLQIPAATKASKSFRAGRSSNFTLTTAGTLVTGTIYTFGNSVIASPLIFNDDSTSPYFDTAGAFNTTTGVFTVSYSAYYDLSVVLNLAIDVTPPAGTTTYSGGLQLDAVLEKSVNSGTSWLSVGSNVAAFGIAGVGTGVATFTSAVQVSYSDQTESVATTTQYRVRLINQSGLIAFTGGAGACSVATKVIGGAGSTASTFYGLINRGDLAWGNTVVMNDTVPTNVTQLDFLTSIIKLEHLILEVDKNDPRVYNIFTREDFYDETDIVDWTDKIDVSQEIEVAPMAELDFNRYRFTYKEDKDYYNKLYLDTYKEVYGTHVQDVENDFSKNEKKVEVVFSPTPVASWNNSAICPRFYTYDKNNTGLQVVKPIEVNIRRCYYQYVNTGINVTVMSFNGTSIALNGYPYCGDIGNPYSPTYDMNFGIPKTIFWTFPGNQYTTNTRYNSRYSKWLFEISNKDSKIVTCKAFLTENDIYNFSFRKTVYIIDSYYRVNKISDYDPQREGLCTLELLKLRLGDPFVPENISVLDDPIGNSGSSNRGVALGNNNINGGVASMITGSNNFISDAASNIQLINCTGVQVGAGVENFVGFNLTDTSVTREDSNSFKSGALIDSQIKDRQRVVMDSTDTTIDYNTYLIDATSTDITLTLKDIGEKITVVRIDNTANAVTLSPLAGININGLSTKSLTSQYEKINLIYTGTEWIF